MLRYWKQGVNNFCKHTKRRFTEAYQLSIQVRYNLRRTNHRHLTIFAQHMNGLTQTQFADLVLLYESGTLSRNKLRRLTVVDSTESRGIIEQLKIKSLVGSRADLTDWRLCLV